MQAEWELVISHFNESLDWLPSLLADPLLAHRDLKIIVYHKGRSVSLQNPKTAATMYMQANSAQYLKAFNGSMAWVTTANLGREQETFVRHLSRGYRFLAPWTAFLQGNPFHSGYVLDDLKRAIRRHPTQRRPCGLLGSPIIVSRADGCTNHCGLAVATTCASLRRAEGVASHISCAEPFLFTNGGMFFASRDAVWARRRLVYNEMMFKLMGEAKYKKRSPLYPYIFERLWDRILSCSSSRPDRSAK